MTKLMFDFIDILISENRPLTWVEADSIYHNKNCGGTIWYNIPRACLGADLVSSEFVSVTNKNGKEYKTKQYTVTPRGRVKHGFYSLGLKGVNK